MSCVSELIIMIIMITIIIFHVLRLEFNEWAGDCVYVCVNVFVCICRRCNILWAAAANQRERNISENYKHDTKKFDMRIVHFYSAAYPEMHFLQCQSVWTPHFNSKWFAT